MRPAWERTVLMREATDMAEPIAPTRCATCGRRVDPPELVARMRSEGRTLPMRFILMGDVLVCERCVQQTAQLLEADRMRRPD